MSRSAEIQRETRETRIQVRLELDGRGRSQTETGLGFLNHMLELLSKHSLIDLEVRAQGDLEVDDHHLSEDLGITLGKALAQALGDKAGIRRYGSCLLPMDEVLVAAAVDLGGRFAFGCDYEPQRETVGDMSTEVVPHFFQSLAANAGMSVHLRFLDPGRNEHHRIEAMFKGFARSLRMAIEPDPRLQGEIPSSKGVL